MIEVSHLTKKYGDHTAVSDLSFTIEDGQIYGFLGPNGAGKSTTMNIMTGCLASTSGEVKIGGYDIFDQPKEAKKKIGYLPEMPPLYIDQTAREYLKFVAQAKGVAKAKQNEQITKVIEETHIEQVADKLISSLSKGYRQRVGIAQALLGDPEVIILDEPTVGLDPAQIIEIRDLIKELGRNHTVILSSHILSEVQAICGKVLIIYKGKLIAFDTPENLREKMESGKTVRITAKTDRENMDNILREAAYITDWEPTDAEGRKSTENPSEAAKFSSAVIRLSEQDDMADICEKLFFTFAEKNTALTEITPVKASLEEIFIELTEEADES